MTELEHIRQIVTDGVVKAPGIPGGGVLVDTSGPFANIVLGQDLMTSFVGPAPGRVPVQHRRDRRPLGPSPAGGLRAEVDG